MKKSSLFVIAVVCVLAIVIITFFGQAVEMGQFSNPITSIVVTNDKTGDIIVEDFDYKSSEATIVFLHVTTYPVDADNPDAYRFMLVDSGSSTTDDGSNNGEDSGTSVTDDAKVSIDETYGKVYFSEPAFVKVRIVATDGGGAHTEVYVWCRGNEVG
ncbi:MAG: hypothetical protein LUD47_03690 [Clostridia bacterium]|nr:hypothetical protein [Clostridia bacterium]